MVHPTAPHFVHERFPEVLLPDASETTVAAAVHDRDDAIAARCRTWNTCDTVVHETRWKGNDARTGGGKTTAWSAPPAPTASGNIAARRATPTVTGG